MHSLFKNLNSFLLPLLMVPIGGFSATISLATKINAGSFTYFKDGTQSDVVRYVYPQDLDGDNVDEVIFAGFTAGDYYVATSIFIFGWKDGKFQNLTEVWLPNGINHVEAVGDIAFGDFNSDGLIDAFLTAYTDSDTESNAYALINLGGYFERINLGPHVWEHGAASTDINNDGYDDVVVSGYTAPQRIFLGSINGLSLSEINISIGGSGVALGDFMNNGTVSAIFTDRYNPNSDDIDTQLASIFVNQNSSVELQPINFLPQPTLTSTYWINKGIAGSHDVRAKTLDFNNDGIDDVLIFGRASKGDSGGWPKVSSIQFLKNNGAGDFTDVTTDFLIGYENYSAVTYNPIFDDYNGDDLVDIFVGEADTDTITNSTSILLKQPDGTYIDTGRSVFTEYIGENNNCNNPIGNILTGPNNAKYFIYEQTDSCDLKSRTIYISELNFDSDEDGILDKNDLDDDNDNVSDDLDAFPLDKNETIDSDGDGLGNNSDPDDDNDGYTDIEENEAGTNPLDALDYPRSSIILKILPLILDQ